MVPQQGKAWPLVNTPSCLDIALDSWRNWSVALEARPTVASPLEGGRTNETFLIQAGSRQFALRLNSPHSRALGIDRQVEAQVLAAASRAGIAPAVYFNNHKWLVTEYLPDQPQLASGSFLNKYRQLLDAVHGLGVNLPPFDYQAHTEHYWQYLHDHRVEIPPSLHQQREEVLPRLASLNRHASRVICHHDPGVHNLKMKAGRLILIDWEYAALGVADMDFAASGVVQPTRQDVMGISEYINQLWELVRVSLAN